MDEQSMTKEERENKIKSLTDYLTPEWDTPRCENCGKEYMGANAPKKGGPTGPYVYVGDWRADL